MNPNPTKRIARTALFEEVAERLRTRIFAHELPPGAWIDEQSLASEYGISRTPMREALKVLAAEGLVNLRPGRGCYVTEITEDDLNQIFPILALLEGRCAAEAAQRLDPAGAARLRSLHAELEGHAAVDDIDRFFDANQRFHLAVQELAGNRWLVQVIQDLRRALKLSRYHSLFREGRLAESLAEHREILAAVIGADPLAAQRSMEAHLLAGRRAIGALRPTSATN